MSQNEKLQRERVNKLHELMRLFKETENLLSQLPALEVALEPEEFKTILDLFVNAGERKHRETINIIHELLNKNPSQETLDFANNTERGVCGNVARIHLARNLFVKSNV